VYSLPEHPVRTVLAIAGLLVLAQTHAGRAARAPGGGVPRDEQARELSQDAPEVSVDRSTVGRSGIGTVPDAVQIGGWSSAVSPDGRNLPGGRGSVHEGEIVFDHECAGCHGVFGEGVAGYPRLASEDKLTGNRPERAVGNFWPYATTLWDYIDRAMPFAAPHSLTPSQVYAVTAYVLNLNELVPDDFLADKDSLPRIVMPNRDGFILHDPRPDTHDEACMTACRPPDAVRIAATAEGSTVTPRETGPLDPMGRQ